jgi:hypothetical protein
MSECKTALRELRKLLAKYKSLKTRNPRARDKLSFSSNTQADMRAKIAMHSERLCRFLSGLYTSALGRIETQLELQQQWHARQFAYIMSKLDTRSSDFSTGRKNPSVMASTDDSLKQELIDENITEADLQLNRDTIAMWLLAVRGRWYTTPVLQDRAGLDRHLRDHHSKVPGLVLKQGIASAEAENAQAVENLLRSRRASRNVTSDPQRINAQTPPGSQPNSPKSKIPTASSTNGNTSRRDSGIAFDDADIRHALSPDRVQDTKIDCPKRSHNDKAVESKQIPVIEPVAEKIDFGLDLSTITGLHYTRFLMSDKCPVFDDLDQVPTPLLPVSPFNRELRFQLAGRFLRTVDDIGKFSVVALVPLPLTAEEILTGVVKRVSVERLARDSRDPKSKYTKRAKILRIRIEGGQNSYPRYCFDELGNENLVGHLTVMFKVIQVAYSQFPCVRASIEVRLTQL